MRVRLGEAIGIVAAFCVALLASGANSQAVERLRSGSVRPGTTATLNPKLATVPRGISRAERLSEIEERPARIERRPQRVAQAVTRPSAGKPGDPRNKMSGASIGNVRKGARLVGPRLEPPRILIVEEQADGVQLRPGSAPERQARPDPADDAEAAAAPVLAVPGGRISVRGRGTAADTITVGRPLPADLPHVTLDWRTYGLPEPPPGEIYARVGRDVVLIDPASRVVVELLEADLLGSSR